MTQSVPSRLPSSAGSAPWWIWAVTVAFVAFGAAPLVPAVDRWAEHHDAAISWLFALKSALETIAFAWAARREELGRRLRQALWLNGLAFSFSAALYATDALVIAQWLGDPGATAYNLTMFGTYVVGLAGMLRMPMRRAGAAGWTTFALDLAASVLGTTAVLIVLVTMPQLRGVPADLASLLKTFAASQVVVLVGLNTLVLQGVARPSRRAFWLYIAMLLGNLANLTAIQFAEVNSLLAVLPHFTSVGTSLLAIWAAVAYRRDPLASSDLAPGPRWFISFNPLPLLATFAVALLLLATAFGHDRASITPLAVVMVVQSAVLIVRLFITARENERLQRLEADRQAAIQGEKMEAVGRLAGGMAHWYNNLLTTVIGHAELGAMQAREGSAVQEGFSEIRNAADRAAALTHQLLAYSGRQFVRSSPISAASWLSALGSSLRARWPDRVVVETKTPDDWVLNGDPLHLDALFRELVANGLDAMGDRGTVVVSGGVADKATPEQAVVLPVPPGPLPGHRRLRLRVRDSARVTPGDLRPVLYDEAGARRRRAGTGLRLRHRHGTPGGAHGREHAGQGHHDDRVPAGVGLRRPCRAGLRPAPRSGRSRQPLVELRSLAHAHTARDQKSGSLWCSGFKPSAPCGRR